MANILLFVLLLYINCVYSEILCEEGFCRTFMLDEGCSATSSHCRINNATHTGMTLPSPTVCNCCEYCLAFLGEGEYCSVGGPGTGITVGRCGHGLTCVPNPEDGHNYCRRMESKCHSAQDAFDERHESGEIGALEQRPMCDGKAKFAAFDCVPAHTCFCQSDEGERLFGEVLNLGAVTMQNMHCGCSRLHNKIRKTIVPGVQFPVIGPRCTADGNFNPVQCMDGTCYCVDPITGIRKDGESVELVTHPLSRLSCYDASLDLFPEQNIGQPPFNYTTPCFEEMEARVELIAQSEEDGFIVDFFSTIPECLPDGTYGRIAETTNGTKICVNEWGRQIEDYEALPGTKEFDTMDCKCALTSLVMSSSVEKPVCCKNGNYRPIQCRRGQCRCVDSDGRQIEKESTDVTTLSCHSEDWRIC